MNGYSKDLRLKVLAAVDRGIPRKQVTELFGVSLSSIKRWLFREGAIPVMSTLTRSPAGPRLRAFALRKWLPKHLEKNPDLTLKEHCQAFFEERGMQVSEATMSRNIAALPGGWPLKKSHR